MKSIYSPGLFATMFLQLPIAVLFAWFVVAYMPDVAWQLWVGLPVSVLMLLVSFGLPILVMHDRNSDSPFEEREWWGFKRQFVESAWRDRKTNDSGADKGLLRILEKIGPHQD